MSKMSEPIPTESNILKQDDQKKELAKAMTRAYEGNKDGVGPNGFFRRIDGVRSTDSTSDCFDIFLNITPDASITLDLVRVPTDPEIERLIQSHGSIISESLQGRKATLTITATDGPFLYELAKAIEPYFLNTRDSYQRSLASDLAQFADILQEFIDPTSRLQRVDEGEEDEMLW